MLSKRIGRLVKYRYGINGITGMNERMKSGISRSESPTVIVGGGIGGLVTGAYLSKQGLPVTLIEQQSFPGGYMSAFKHKGYEFEIGLQLTPLEGTPFHTIVKELRLIEDYGINFTLLPEVSHHITPQSDITIPNNDPQAFWQILKDKYPHEINNIIRFKELTHKFIREFDILIQKIVDFKLETTWEKILALPKATTILSLRNMTAEQLLDKYFKDKGLIEIMGCYCRYGGETVKYFPALGLLNFLSWMLINPIYYIKPRSQVMVYIYIYIYIGRWTS